MSKAVAKYVGARQGPAGAANRLNVAADVGARLYQVLDRIARNGLDNALEMFGARPSENSVAAIADALMTLVCLGGAGDLVGILDESMARAACDETFIELYESGSSLANLTPDQVPKVIQSFAVNAACLLITREIGTAVVDRPRTENESRDLQSSLKSIISSAMSLNLAPRTSGEYTIRELRDAISGAYRDAFRIISAGRQS
ncbi:MAG: hypothetical protein ACYDA1_00075 [Vulcanimicrobiaceae bacterium]